mmetsp:Transcript_27323/g.73869  ORF Transcript_27323/g.73869 Transcript_27323/m.73869 type:complete len:251 (+) Transcript_27323:357-1109(+)
MGDEVRQSCPSPTHTCCNSCPSTAQSPTLWPCPLRHACSALPRSSAALLSHPGSPSVHSPCPLPVRAPTLCLHPIGPSTVPAPTLCLHPCCLSTIPTLRSRTLRSPHPSSTVPQRLYPPHFLPSPWGSSALSHSSAAVPHTIRPICLPHTAWHSSVPHSPWPSRLLCTSRHCPLSSTPCCACSHSRSLRQCLWCSYSAPGCAPRPPSSLAAAASTARTAAHAAAAPASIQPCGFCCHARQGQRQSARQGA